MEMKEITVKPVRRKIDYARIIKCLGLSDDFIDYAYHTYVRAVSMRRQARYFLQYKKVDIRYVDIFIKNSNIVDYGHLYSVLNGRLEQCYLED